MDEFDFIKEKHLIEKKYSIKLDDYFHFDFNKETGQYLGMKKIRDVSEEVLLDVFALGRKALDS